MEFDWQVALGTALVGMGDRGSKMYDDYQTEQRTIREEDRQYQTEMRKDQEKYNLAQQREAKRRKDRMDSLPEGVDADSYEGRKWIEEGAIVKPEQTIDEKIADVGALDDAAQARKQNAWTKWQEANPSIEPGSAQWHNAAAAHGIITGGQDPAQARQAELNAQFDEKILLHQRLVEEKDIDPYGKESQRIFNQIFEIENKGTGAKPPTPTEWNTLQKNAKAVGDAYEPDEDEIVQKQAELADAGDEKATEEKAIREIKKDEEAAYFKNGLQNWGTAGRGQGGDSGGMRFSEMQNRAFAKGLARENNAQKREEKLAAIRKDNPQRAARIEQLIAEEEAAMASGGSNPGISEPKSQFDSMPTTAPMEKEKKPESALRQRIQNNRAGRRGTPTKTVPSVGRMPSTALGEQPTISDEDANKARGLLGLQ